MINTSPDHAPHTPPPGTPASPHNAALLIDFDNVTMGIRSDLQNQLRKLLSSEVISGRVSVQRAYADWRRYPQYIVPLSEASIDLIFAPAFGSNKKNATDIRLAIDALELVFTRPEIGTFILLSGDSDFSSLVLKLKEYGKFVIGVGIRESASDLLVQNCDEYYSYSELTGLSKQVETDTLPRDPWELVVEAVDRMESQGDVMRSDRLKQIMQEMDPHFDEKDAGYNKFSKFVQESARRGLVRLEKMDNGQFEVALGPDANTSLSEGRSSSDPEDTTEKRARFQGSAEKSALGKSGMVLADALALLKRTLRELGAFGDESTQADKARERMRELADDASDPILDGRRFHRLLRQAHDASVVELVKTEDETYLVKLMPEAVPDVDDSATSVASPAEVPEEPKAPKKRSPRKRATKAATVDDSEITEQTAASTKTVEEQGDDEMKAVKKKTTRKKKTAAKVDPAAPPEDPPSVETEAAEPPKKSTRKKSLSTAKEPAESSTVQTSKTTSSSSRSMRMRSGSRGAVKRDVVKDATADQGPDDRSALREPSELSSGRRSLRARGGSRSASPPADASKQETTTPETGKPEQPPTLSPPAAQKTDTKPADETEMSLTDKPDPDRSVRCRVNGTTGRCISPPSPVVVRDILMSHRIGACRCNKVGRGASRCSSDD